MYVLVLIERWGRRNFCGMQNPKCPFILFTMIISYQVWSWSTPALEEKKWEYYCFSLSVSFPSFNQSDDHGLIFPPSQNLSGGWFVYHFNTLSCLCRRRHHHTTNLLWRYVLQWFSGCINVFLHLFYSCYLFFHLETIATRLSAPQGKSSPGKSPSNPRTKTFLLLRYIWILINDLSFIVFMIITWYGDLVPFLS